MSSPLTSSPTPLFCPLPATPTRIAHGPKVRSSSSHFPSPALPLHSHHRTLSKSISQIWPTVFLQSDREYFSPTDFNIPLLCPTALESIRQDPKACSLLEPFHSHQHTRPPSVPLLFVPQAKLDWLHHTPLPRGQYFCWFSHFQLSYFSHIEDWVGEPD